MQDLIILIPALNEFKSLRKISLNLKKKKYNFLILDDGSNDGSDIFFKKNKIKFIKNKNRLGYEGNLINGITNILKKYKKYKYILTMDGDGEHDISNIKNIYNAITNRKLEVVIGNRKIKNRLIEILISKIFNFFYGVKDPLSGFKIYEIRSLKKQIKLIKRNFFLVDLIINFSLKNYKIGYIQIKTTKRKGSSRVGNWVFANLKMIKILNYALIKKLFH